MSFQINKQIQNYTIRFTSHLFLKFFATLIINTTSTLNILKILKKSQENVLSELVVSNAVASIAIDSSIGNFVRMLAAIKSTKMLFWKTNNIIRCMRKNMVQNNT